MVQLRYECKLPYENNKNIYVCRKLAFYARPTLGTLRLWVGVCSDMGGMSIILFQLKAKKK